MINETLIDLISRTNNMHYYDDVFKWLKLKNVFADEKLVYILINSNVEDASEYLISNNISFCYNALIYSLICGNYINLIEKYFDELIRDNSHLLELHSILKYTNLNETILNDYIEENHGRVIDEMLEYSMINTVSDDEQNKCKLLLESILDEVLCKEKLNYYDIYPLVSGGTSHPYKIGNVVIKVGYQKRTYKLPHHRRLLKPYLRKNIYANDSKKIIYCLEVLPYVDTNSVNEEHVYTIFKELLDDNILWTDPKMDNIGKSNNNFVILDLDHLYDLNLTYDTYYKGPMYHKYRNRYKQEQKCKRKVKVL